MEILNAGQVREADRFTMHGEPVSSIDLMERAASGCVHAILNNASLQPPFLVFCGPGNNGGDGLAIARLLHRNGYQVRAILLNPGNKLSADCLTNLKRMRETDSTLVQELNTLPADFAVNKNETIIDALFGTGLSHPVNEPCATLVELINNSGNTVISIDLPSGMYSDKPSLNTDNKIIKALETLTFQYLKPALIVSENAPLYGKVSVLDIGLLPEAIGNMSIRWHMTDRAIIGQLLKPRPAVSHKGTFGHALLIAGGKGKMGAALLASCALVRSGAGLLTVMVPRGSESIIHTILPDAMVVCYDEKGTLEKGFDFTAFDAIGIGPGIGVSDTAQSLLLQLLIQYKKPILLDADALNMMANDSEMALRLPPGSILTPHPGEFKRLFGSWKNDFEKLEIQQARAQQLGVFIVLKGYHTTIATPDGHLYFNPTGNAGMAKGGAGDALSGLITGLAARGYSPLASCLLGVYLHGMAGDLAAESLTMEGMTAGDIHRFLPMAWKLIL